MPTLAKGVRRLVAEAEDEIETWSVAAAMARLGDEAVVFVDIRDVRELWREAGGPVEPREAGKPR